MQRSLAAFALTFFLAVPAVAETVSFEDTVRLYADHCAACHGHDRLGGQGPALLPENMGRLKPAEARKVVAEGRAATQMEGFAARLAEPQIAALVDYIFKPLAEMPDWTMDKMRESHSIVTPLAKLPAKPVYKSDPLNLFTVIETGDHHATILDGDRFEPLWRFPTHFAVHGGAKYSPDGRFVYLASRDGWVSMHDLYSLKTVAEIRAGINTRNIAVSSDGKYVMVGNMLPHNLVVLNARDLSPERIIPVTDYKGVKSSRVSAVYAAPPRKSFIVALRDFKEIWELSWDPKAPPVLEGYVHNSQPGQEEAGLVLRQPFAIRRVKTETFFDDFFFNPGYYEVIGASRDGDKGAVYNLDARRKAAELELSGMPHLASGIYWKRDGQMVMATPHLKEAAISVIDMQTWKTIKKIDTLGPGFFLRSHEKTPYAWADVFFGPHKDSIHIIDKQKLEIVHTVRPAPGKTAAHVEFTRDGKYALVSVWEMDGALVVYDAATFKEVKRIPMKKPVGKYNVYNKITYAEGTSH